MEDYILKGEHPDIARLALRRLLRSHRSRVLTVIRRQERQGRPRPGGAARACDAGGPISGGGYLMVQKSAMREGGDLRIVLSMGNRATFVHRTLRLFGTGLPDTVLGRCVGRRVADVVDLSDAGILERLGTAEILEAERHQTHDLLTLDIPMTEVRASDVAAETEGLWR